MRPRSKSFNPASGKRFSFNSSCGVASAIRCINNYRSFDRPPSVASGGQSSPRPSWFSLGAEACRVERSLTIFIAHPDQDHTDELTDVEQFRMAHPVAHSANAGQRRANGDEDIAD
jgi:hypothetical protein